LHDRREAILAILLDAQARHIHARRRRRRVIAASAAVLMAAALVSIGVLGVRPGTTTPADALSRDTGASSVEASIIADAPDALHAPDAPRSPDAAADATPPSRLVIHRGDESTLRLVTHVALDPTVLDRLRREGTGRVRMLDDRDLLRTLAEAGHRTGLISVRGTTSLTTPVVEEVPIRDDGGARRRSPNPGSSWGSGPLLEQIESTRSGRAIATAGHARASALRSRYGALEDALARR